MRRWTPLVSSWQVASCGVPLFVSLFTLACGSAFTEASPVPPADAGDANLPLEATSPLDAADSGDGAAPPGDATPSEASGSDGPACTPGQPPGENGCIADANSVFVARSVDGGSDLTGKGTMSQPYATL